MKFSRVLCLLALFSFTCHAGIKVGDTPHDYLGTSLEGERIDFEQFKGKVVVITFWATWCPPCMREIPILSGIQKSVATEQLQIVAISYHEDKKRFRMVAESLADNPMLFTFDRRNTAAKFFDVQAIPHMLIVGRDGRVKAKHIGYKESELPNLIEELNTLLAEEYASKETGTVLNTP